MVLRLGPFRIDRSARVLYRDGQVVPLTPKAFDTLLLLVDRAGEVVTKEELIKGVWPDTHVEEGSLARNISSIRQALGERRGTADYIQTISKRGYRLAMAVEPEGGAEPPAAPPLAPAAAEAPPGAGRRGTSRWRWGVAAVALVLVALAAAALLRRDAGASPNVPSGTRAYQLFMKGQYARERRDREGFATAKSYFDQALALDPGLAAAHVAKAEVLLAECWMGWLPLLETEARAEAILSQALSLDPNLADAHGALAQLRWHQWRWAEVKRELEQAIALAPDQGKWYDQYAVQYCLPLRRFDEALENLRRAQGLDPLSRATGGHTAAALFYAGKLEEAIAEHRQVLVLEPRYAGSHFGLGQIYAEQKRWETAEESFRRALEIWPDHPAVIAAEAHMLAESGQSARARTALARIDRLSQDKGAAGYLRASVHAGLGEKELALAALEEALAARVSQMVWCGIDPDFRTLHGHPRFTRILEAIGLPVVPN